MKALDFQKLARQNRARNGEQISPRNHRKSLAQERADKLLEIRRHPERAPSPVRVLSREEIQRLYGR